MNLFKTKTLTLTFLICFVLNGLYSSPIMNKPQSKVGEIAIDPCVIVIFGATGDLTARKLLPALYHLDLEKQLSTHTAIVGFARNSHTDESFRKQMSEAIDQFSRTKPRNKDFWHQFENKLFYQESGFEQDQGYKDLQQKLEKIDQELGTQGNRIYYLATPPSYFPTIIRKLHEHKLLSHSGTKNWSRVIIEKPFGRDIESAADLQNEVSQHLDESQVYRIDHYLAKEGFQNLFTLRFENALFEPLWNSKHIDNVQITLAEDIGIGTRANFWEETGSLRDVFQNHLIQLLAVVAMEPPPQLEAPFIHQEKIKVLNALRPFPTSELNHSIIRGQYVQGKIKGIEVPGYKQEAGVSPDSTSETYIAAKIFIDNPRWKGVPFYVRGGKRLLKQVTEIVITFKNTLRPAEPAYNFLLIRIQPNPGIYIKTSSKVPGLDKTTQPVIFGYRLDSYFDVTSPEAYEKLIYDCIKGDSSLYVDAEEQLAAWRLFTPVLDYWKSHPHEPISTYEAGTWGPSSADQMLRKNGHEWQEINL